MRTIFKKDLTPFILIGIPFVLITIWFSRGLLFAGGEEGLSFYNPSRSLKLFSYLWYDVGTGFYQLVSPIRIPYFSFLAFLYNLGFSNLFLQAFTLFVIATIGMLSVYFLIKVTLQDFFEKVFLNRVALVSAIFYLLNPFSTTQIWGRSLSSLIFSFALIPLFLLLFILTLQRRNLIFIIMAALSSFVLSNAYSNPAIVITSWASVSIYLLFYLYTKRKNLNHLVFAVFSFILLVIFWGLINFFWINPFLQFGKEFLTINIEFRDNIQSLEGVSANSTLPNLLRLIHREYYDGTYGEFVKSVPFVLLTWFIPFIAIFSIPLIKKSRHFLFYGMFFLLSIFITLGANFPTGWLLKILFKNIPVLQALRNPYEKFGINLLLAYLPFFSIGIIVLSEKISIYFKKSNFKNIFLFLFLFLICVVEVWPMWRGIFAGGKIYNPWVKVPEYYKQADDWISKQPGDFYILQVPLVPEDSVTFTWEHPFDGIEPSEYLFNKLSIARNLYDNRDYYSALVDRFGYASAANYRPVFQLTDKESMNNLDFRDSSLFKELSKLNVRYIVLHNDTDYQKRRAISPEKTAEYLSKQDKISKIRSFDRLDIYQVDIDPKIDLIYSPEAEVKYNKINSTFYEVDVVSSGNSMNLLFLKQFNENWVAYSDDQEFRNHTKAFSFANMWTIDKKGEFKVYIKYKPQESVYLGMQISMITLVAITTVLGAYFLKTRKLFL